MAEEQSQTNQSQGTPVENQASGNVAKCTRRHISRCCVALWTLGGLIAGLILGIWISFAIHDKIALIVSDQPAAPVDTLDQVLQPVDTMPVIITQEEINILNDPTTDPEKTSKAVIGDGLDKTSVKPIIVPPPAAKTQSQTPAPRTSVLRESRTDTITKKRHLATMAQEYYGNEAYWVYIYRENMDKYHSLRNYVPGTVVHIPPFDKYRTSPDHAQNLRDAKEMSKELQGHK